MLFLFYILYDKAQNEIGYIRNNLLLEMENYSFGKDDIRFSKKIVSKDKKEKLYSLYEDTNNLYILAPIINAETKELMAVVMTPSGTIMVPYAKNTTEVQKVYYSKSEYMMRINQMQYDLFVQLLLFALGALLVSLVAAWYTLNPLRSSLRLLEDFIKDIIHDLNTPLSAILINLKMIESKEEEIDSIRTAAQTIEMLHHNLDAYLREQKQTEEKFELNEVINRYIIFFASLYDHLDWDIAINKCILITDKQAFERIIYNLFSNACKYNTSDGKIEIVLKGTILSIRNNSYGVNNPDRVFERFYKESERGMGIGLHIVDKLCQTLQIEKRFFLEDTDVILELECKSILHNQK